MILYCLIITTVFDKYNNTELGNDKLIATEFAKPKQNSDTNFLSTKETFNYFLKEYKENLNFLDNNLKLQALLMIIAFLLVLRNSDKLSFFSNEVPLRWLHLFVPILLIYLWLKFGFLLDNLIEGRIEAVELVKNTEMNSENSATIKTLFSDAGFIDGWMLSFIDTTTTNYSGIDGNSKASSRFFLIATLGLFISTGHACILAITIIGFRRYTRLKYKYWLTGYYLVPLVPLSLLLASHLQFVYGGKNDPAIPIFTFISTWPMVFFLTWVSVKIDEKLNPISINNLRRKRVMIHPGPLLNSNGTKNELRSIALIGDSLSTSFHVDSNFKMLISIWKDWGASWFVNKLGSTNNIRSVYERIGEWTHFVAYQHACATAKIDGKIKRNFKDIITDTWHFSDQINEVLIGKFPEIVIIWIGHNALNWKEHEEKTFKELSKTFISSYEAQLERLVAGGLNSNQKCVIYVFGLINFESFFKARLEAENMKKKNSDLYPYLEKDYQYFVSMKPEFRLKMIELSRLYNTELEKLCDEIQKKISNTKVKLVYSNALARINLDTADNLNNKDAWHPSKKGHQKIAEAASKEIVKSFSFLEWDAH
ncbi:SGNH/GDSL hydrolase family protein [Flavivirga aquimarina]|uniref:SGNH/GDSL hydrolase family protein n=1 Tax=Flavivirga aquimarina TaxID=2027862 RepID=UPI0026DF2EBA|nr:SGNH/GDSL hydrolase family protein [Flavivirga aquimarina]